MTLIERLVQQMHISTALVFTIYLTNDAHWFYSIILPAAAPGDSCHTIIHDIHGYFAGTEVFANPNC